MSDFNTLKPGRELDRLVAKRVFGHFVGKRKATTVYDYAHGLDGLFECDKEKTVADMEGGWWRDMAHYSTEPAAAAEVWRWVHAWAVEWGGCFAKIDSLIEEESRRAGWANPLTYLWAESEAYCVAACKIALALAAQEKP